METVECQIDWFERTRVDQNKRPRYANLNLKDINNNYQEQLAAKLAAKRAELDKQKHGEQKRASMQIA